jgi:RNA polymerase sigma-70 factor (ECF subfamily)
MTKFSTEATPATAGGQPLFQTTRWSRVLRACGADSALAGRALTELCEAYWYPLYAFVRRSGREREDALDLTQEFFARLLEKRWLADADPARGRFRSFLPTALKHVLANEWHRGQTRKRGGGLVFVSRDAFEPEARYALEPSDATTPETLYERRWAEALLDRVLARLADEYRVHPLGWEVLQRFIVETRAEVSLVETAGALGVTESALRSVVHKLRRRFQELVRAEVAETVDDPTEVEDELRHLAALFQR